MSSKLHRGGVAADPVCWKRVSDTGSPIGGAQAVAGVNASAPAPWISASAQSSSGEDPQAAYQRGLAEGKAAGRQDMSIQLQATNTRMARTIEDITGLKQRLRHEAEQDVVALALATAKRILHRELATDPEALLGVVKAALEKINLSEVHRVRLNPDDAPGVQQFLQKMGLPHRVEVAADPALDRGALILESNRGLLDASIHTQLAEIERGFADLIRRT